MSLPTDSKARKDIPMARGLLDYFPDALAAVAEVSRVGNEKHNPGEDIHWARGKSSDHADCVIRHLVDRGKIDPTTNLRHSAEGAWRYLALLQEELEAAGLATLPRGARLPPSEKPTFVYKCSACHTTHYRLERFEEGDWTCSCGFKNHLQEATGLATLPRGARLNKKLDLSHGFEK